MARLTEGLRNAGSATAGTLVGNVLSLCLPFVVTAWFAPGPSTDAYFYALGAVLFLNITVSVAVEAATTPFVVSLLPARDGSISRFVRRTQAQGVLVCAVLTVVGIATVHFALLPHTSFSVGQRQDVLDTMFLLAPLPVLVTWNSVLSGACYAFKSFGTPTATVGLRTAFALAFGFVFREQLELAAVPIGLVVGEAVRVVLLEAHVRRIVPLRVATLDAESDVSDGSPDQLTLKPFWRTASPQAASMTVGGLSPVIDKTVAISAGVGAVTTFELAQRLVYTPILLLLSGVGIVLGSRWAHAITAGEWSALNKEYKKVLRLVPAIGFIILIVALPSAFLLRPVAENVLSISDPTLLAVTFTATALGIPFALSSQVSIRLLLAARETRAMPYLTVAVVVLNLGLDLILVRMMGLPGIGIASSAVNVFNACAYGFLARRMLQRHIGVDRGVRAVGGAS